MPAHREKAHKSDQKLRRGASKNGERCTLKLARTTVLATSCRKNITAPKSLLSNQTRKAATRFNAFQSHRLFLSTIRKPANRNLKIEFEEKNVLQNVIPSILLNRKIKGTQDWISIREHILKSNSRITLKTIDSAILSVCTSAKNYQLGIEYIQFLKHEKIPLGLATLGKYFKLIYLKNYPENLSQVEEDEVMNLYQELRKVYKTFDGTTCDNLIHVLSLSKHWRECFKLLDEVRLTCEPTRASYSAIIAACFRNEEHEQGWMFLKECAEKDRFPNTVAYSAYIDKCTKPQNIPDLEKLFDYLRTYDIKCDLETGNKIIDVYKKLNLNATIVTTRSNNNNNNVKCRNCGKHLQKIELEDEEFEHLKKTIFQNVIIGSNVFYKTTPKEVDEFKLFVANMKKYDVIIDGLNVAYSVGTKQPSHVYAFLLKSVVQHFAVQKKKVLVLGRTHMQKWSKTDWSYVTKNSDIFLAQTLSHDDPYLLYCALNSAKDTIVVSRDLMRNYAFKLNETKLKILFNRWLSQCQYQLLHVNDGGKVFFKYPLPYGRTAQKIENIWHIPCDNSSSTGDDTIHNWLCLNK
ncbi:hypothetical protein FQR65_LT02839 [Abscondita terminalis]|nr:hypothetical protein FQR65_LT02839 [Abscondita terminalis]